MIFSITGKITHKDNDFFVLETDNIGYQVFTSGKFLKKIKIDDQFKVFTYLYLREDRQELYGFENIEELNFFKELLPVSGIGPKIAQGLLALGELKEIKNAIKEGNIAFIRQVKGIGEKTAERVIIEMRGKVEKILKKPKDLNRQVINALTKLGYKNYEIQEALKDMPEEITDLKEQVKMALKILGQK